jgi:predicted small lipoprotein YifL
MKIFLIATAAIILSSCGIKGPPLPPLKEETVQSQKAFEELNFWSGEFISHHL